MIPGHYVIWPSRGQEVRRLDLRPAQIFHCCSCSQWHLLAPNQLLSRPQRIWPCPSWVPMRDRATSQIEQPRNPSPSQGTEHVALRAIEVVSNKDTPRPNARRFAIRIRRSRDALGDMRFKAIARGPISPAQSYQREAGDLSGAGLKARLWPEPINPCPVGRQGRGEALGRGSQWLALPKIPYGNG